MTALVEEARRQLAVCNACRYCEGYCAVFPALERRNSLLLAGDVAHLANLCHDCRACWQACMYAPPHDFGVNLPALFSQARVESYVRWAWPPRLGWAFRHSSLAVLAGTAAGLALALVAALASGGTAALLGMHVGPGAFYATVPYVLMVVPALVVSAFVLVVLYGGFIRSWREAAGRASELLNARLWVTAGHEAVALRWLSGGGGGCYYPGRARPSSRRRALHGLVIGGLAADFVATAVAAAFQDLMDWQPPYPVLSAPVLLGSLGGVALIAGCTGLLLLKGRSDELAVPAATAMDVAFLATLELAAVTGMLTLALRSTPAMGVALVVHLATLVALYLTVPYGKLVHGVYRFAALLKDVAERSAEARSP